MADETSRNRAEPHDDVVATKHRLRVGRTSLDYTATTGRVVLREEVYEEGRFTGFAAKAEVSITSYVVAGDVSRPVTFAFNGGPAAPACGCTSGCSAHDGC